MGDDPSIADLFRAAGRMLSAAFNHVLDTPISQLSGQITAAVFLVGAVWLAMMGLSELLSWNDRRRKAGEPLIATIASALRRATRGVLDWIRR